MRKGERERLSGRKTAKERPFLLVSAVTRHRTDTLSLLIVHIVFLDICMAKESSKSHMHSCWGIGELYLESKIRGRKD